MSHWARMRARGPNPALVGIAWCFLGIPKGMGNDHRAGGWTQSREQQCHFSGTELSWAELWVGWMLLLRWNKLLWSLLPFSCWVGEDPVWLGSSGSSAPLPSGRKCWQCVWELCYDPSAFTLCHCTHALLSHMLSLRKQGQDIAGWDHLMCDLFPGWCPKESQRKSTDSFFCFLGSEGPLCQDSLHKQGWLSHQKAAWVPFRAVADVWWL